LYSRSLWKILPGPSFKFVGAQRAQAQSLLPVFGRMFAAPGKLPHIATNGAGGWFHYMEANIGLGRIVALHYHASTLYQIH
jgi:hypothetical protein